MILNSRCVTGCLGRIACADSWRYSGIMKVLINLPKKTHSRGEYVAVPQREYRRFLKYQTELGGVLRKIKRGEREVRTGRAKVINSVRDLM